MLTRPSTMHQIDDNAGIGKEKNREKHNHEDKEATQRLAATIQKHLSHSQYSGRLWRDVTCMQKAIVRENGESSAW